MHRRVGGRTDNEEAEKNEKKMEERETTIRCNRPGEPEIERTGNSKPRERKGRKMTTGKNERTRGDEKTEETERQLRKKWERNEKVKERRLKRVKEKCEGIKDEKQTREKESKVKSERERRRAQYRV